MQEFDSADVLRKLRGIQLLKKFICQEQGHIFERAFWKFDLSSGRFILGDPGTVSWVGRNSVTKVSKKKRRSPWVLTLTRPFPNGFANASSWMGTRKSCLLLCLISKKQNSESVPCVLTWSSTRGSFVLHIALLVYRKSKALFVESLTVNASRGFRTQRKICHVQVKNQFTRKFVLLESIVLSVCFWFGTRKMVDFCLFACD